MSEPEPSLRQYPELNPGDSDLPRAKVILRSTALSNGMNADDVQRKRKQREWVSLRPGAYLEAGVLRSLDVEQRHILLIEATMPSMNAQAVLSHQSAACLLGINLWRPVLRAVQITNPGAASGHRRRSLQTFRAPVDDDEIVIIGGQRITSPARTVIDLARTLPFEDAVVAADSALHRRLVSADDLRRSADRAPRRPGMRNAHLVIAFADGRSESAGESRSRVMMHNAGLPTAEPQFKVRTAAGTVIACTDFGWDKYRTIGEFDGAEKYGRLLKPNNKPGDTIYQEKLREEGIRDLGWWVVRWTWEELNDPTALARKIWRVLERGSRFR